jgi:hypothetical protein
MLEALRSADMKLAAVAWRLATANATLCDRLEPGTGLLLHLLDQYQPALRDKARLTFGFETTVAVEGVVPGSPAEAAGVKPNDSIAIIAGTPAPTLAEIGRSADTDRVNALHARLAQLPPTASLPLTLVRAGSSREARIAPVAACRSRFELRIGDDAGALADGVLVQIPSKLVEDYDEAEVAVLVAHELAHNILRHRERLEARGVDFGMFAAFGKNVKFFRQAETEADILAIYLLANAGYDPAGAPAFWRKFGPAEAGGVLRARTHPDWRDRVATMEREAAKVTEMSVRPIIPPLVAQRDKPLDGNWQAILVREAR